MKCFVHIFKRSLNNLDHWIAEDACKCHHENFSNRKSILSRVTAKKKDKRTACDAMFGLTKETPRYSINVRMRVSELAQTRVCTVEEFPVRFFFKNQRLVHVLWDVILGWYYNILEWKLSKQTSYWCKTVFFSLKNHNKFSSQNNVPKYSKKDMNKFKDLSQQL